MFGLADRRERAAAKWLARMGNEGTAFYREKFERWRSDAGNAQAFDEVAKSWGLDLPVAATRYSRETSDNSSRSDMDAQPRAGGSRRVARVAFAAVLLATVSIVGFERAGWFGGSEAGSSPQVAANIATGAHQVRAFRLSDGSIATLGADSELALAYARDVRSLTLLRGHARFDVAHDSNDLLRFMPARASSPRMAPCSMSVSGHKA